MGNYKSPYTLKPNGMGGMEPSKELNFCPRSLNSSKNSIVLLATNKHSIVLLATKDPITKHKGSYPQKWTLFAIGQMKQRLLEHGATNSRSGHVEAKRLK